MSQIQLSLPEKQFAQSFIRDFSSPYAIQQPETHWKTKYKPISDPLIRAHLAQDYWIATKAAWYPLFFNLDIDRPKSETLEKIYNKLEFFNISESQRALMSTPSYQKTGNFRIYLKLEYNNRPVTWKLGYEALNNTFGELCEIYPQKRRKDRLPLGKNQDLITENGRILNNLSWQEELHYLLKIDPVPIENLPRQPLLAFPEDANAENPKTWALHGEVADLRNEGLTAHATRHESQFLILNDFWRLNFQPQDAAFYVKKWIRHNHNGFSKTVNAGRWKEIHDEIDRQVKWIWARPQTLLPDTPHGLNAAITKSDLKLAAELFKGDAVKQKQLTKLIAYMRPRKRHEWIFVPTWVWQEEVASMHTYKKFIAELEGKGLLESNNSYRVDHYSKKFKLKLPTTSEQPIDIDGRNITDFYEALSTAYNSIREIAEVTGLNRMTIWNNLQQK